MPRVRLLPRIVIESRPNDGASRRRGGSTTLSDAFGTDFTMMLTAFPGRTQRQLKNKFKRENRTQSALVSLALDASIAADLTAPLVIEAAPVAAVVKAL